MTYQLLPPLAEEDLQRLKESIIQRGVEVPVVIDEHGDIIDGHHRAMIAESLGMEYPRQTRAGLVDFEKRLLAVTLNVDRRHLTEGQKTLVGELIEPDIAERARLRQGTRTDLEHSGHVSTMFSKARDEVAGAVGLGSGRTYERHKGLIAAARIHAPEILSAVQNGTATMRDVRSIVRRAKKFQQAEEIRHEPPAMPDGPFRVIVADPPWSYYKRPGDGTQRGQTPYPIMETAEIAALRVPAIAHDDCILWLWTTNAHLRDAFAVLDAWGFEQKTMLTWAKDRMGVGDWLRGQTEHCLLAIRGKPIVTLTNETTLVQAPVGEHSQKPELFYTLVERLCPGSRVELFARREREGWTAFGNEVGRGAHVRAA